MKTERTWRKTQKSYSGPIIRPVLSIILNLPLHKLTMKMVLLYHFPNFLMKGTNFLIKWLSRAAGVAQRFSATFSPGGDTGDPRSSPTSGSLHGACFSLWLCLCLSLSLCLSWLNKIKSFLKMIGHYLKHLCNMY